MAAALLAHGLQLPVSAQASAAARELLNSERIAAEFGSYGVEVLVQTDALRISNLYSGTGDSKICRTFAVVRYPARVDPRVAAEHSAIVAGGSLGAVFSRQGWDVRKTHLYYGQVAASAQLAELMRVAPGTALAEHVYVLHVAKGGAVIEYAALVEIHHPDHLRSTDLAAIYGSADATQSAELVTGMLELAAERAR